MTKTKTQIVKDKPKQYKLKVTIEDYKFFGEKESIEIKVTSHYNAKKLIQELEHMIMKEGKKQ